MCACLPLCFFITLLRLCSLAAIQSFPGTDQVWPWDGRRRRKQGRDGKVDLLATINIKLLYKAPVDNIKGLAEQSKQSSFIKRGLGGVGGRQRWHPSVDGDILNEPRAPTTLLSLRFRWWLQAVRPVCLPGGGAQSSVLHRHCRAAPSHGSASWWDMNMYAG